MFLRRTWAEIDLDALIENFRAIRAACSSGLMAVVKADAYGHGAAVIAPILQSEGAEWFAVSNLQEAIDLRASGVDRPILVLGYTPPEAAPLLSEYGISQALFDFDYAAALSLEADAQSLSIPVHLKLDTGMGRIGFDCRTDELLGLADAFSAAELPGLRLEGAFTHFAAADRSGDPGGDFTENQYRHFIAATSAIRAKGYAGILCHCCNSAGLMLEKDKQLDLCRPGIILYGLSPDADLEPNLPLKPVMAFKSVVSMVKDVPKGTSLSYGRTFIAPDNMRIATVSAGYADGFFRLLSNCGEVLVHDARARIVGRICMDQFLIDVTSIPGVARGDEVTLFGPGLSADEQAGRIGTISYELVCAVSKRVPRVYLRGGKIISK